MLSLKKRLRLLNLGAWAGLREVFRRREVSLECVLRGWSREGAGAAKGRTDREHAAPADFPLLSLVACRFIKMLMRFSLFLLAALQI